METLYKFTQCRKWCFQRFRCRKWILFCEYLLYRFLYNYVCIVCRYITVMVQPGTLLQNALCSCSHKSSRYPTEKMSLQKSLKVGGNHPLHSSFFVILQGASLPFTKKLLHYGRFPQLLSGQLFLHYLWVTTLSV